MCGSLVAETVTMARASNGARPLPARQIEWAQTLALQSDTLRWGAGVSLNLTKPFTVQVSRSAGQPPMLGLRLRQSASATDCGNEQQIDLTTPGVAADDLEIPRLDVLAPVLAPGDVESRLWPALRAYSAANGQLLPWTFRSSDPRPAPKTVSPRPAPGAAAPEGGLKAKVVQFAADTQARLIPLAWLALVVFAAPLVEVTPGPAFLSVLVPLGLTVST